MRHLKQLIGNKLNEIIAIRRKLHQMPELSLKNFKQRH